MDENPNQAQLDRRVDEEDKDESEALELILFQVSECYVYMIPPRMSAASYRADEWNVNKWDWEGSLKIVSKGEECIITLEEKAHRGAICQSISAKWRATSSGVCSR